MKEQWLYHYCSVSSLIEILKNKTMKFSEITKSNDCEEIVFLWNQYLSYIEEFSNNQVAPHMLEYEIKNQLSKTDFFVTCFSEKQDDLHMWNCYAKEGICIGFNKEKLSSWAERIYPFDNGIVCGKENHEGATFGKVEYYSKNAAKDFVKDKCTGIQFVTDAFMDVFNKAPLVKTDFWRQEAEWRISVPLIYGDGIDYDSIPKDSNVVIPQKVTSSIGSNGRFPLCINFYVPFEPEIIENIMLAPDCKVAPEDIKKMLHIYGFDFLIDKVLLSNGSLR